MQAPIRLSPQAGFTLVELVAVIIIGGILTVSASAMFSRTGYDTSNFADRTRAVLSYAQKLAVANRRYTMLQIDSGGIALSLCRDPHTAANPCGTGGNPWLALSIPDGSSTLDVPAGTSISTSPVTSNLNFDPHGRPNIAGNLTLSIASSALARDLTVEQETGYVR